jgi:hydroxymethylglutaryl-CoA lyase
MASTSEVLSSPILRSLHSLHPTALSFPVLVPNAKGLSALLSLLSSTPNEPPITSELALFVSASEGFSRANLNTSIAESMASLPSLIEQAKANGLRVRAYVSVVLGCPFQGKVDPEQVASITQELIAMGAYEVSLGDTIGVGTPDGWEALVATVAKRVEVGKLAVTLRLRGGPHLRMLMYLSARPIVMTRMGPPSQTSFAASRSVVPTVLFTPTLLIRPHPPARHPYC